jgi:hypothetical protein
LCDYAKKPRSRERKWHLALPRSLECCQELLVYVFESVPGALVVPDVRNYFGAEQVDIAEGNEERAFPGLPDKFLVECKNYSASMDSKAVGYFLYICLSRGLELAVVAAAEGLAGKSADTTYTHSLALSASAMKCKLVVITTADLLNVKDTDDLKKLLRLRFLQAWSSGGIGAP